MTAADCARRRQWVLAVTLASTAAVLLVVGAFPGLLPGGVSVFVQNLGGRRIEDVVVTCPRDTLRLGAAAENRATVWGAHSSLRSVLLRA